jgi:histidine decarboxylase
MSLGKHLTDRRGCLTETVYDGATCRFVERAVAHPFLPAEPLARPGRASARVDRVLAETEERMRKAHATHLGYPYNLVGHSPVPASLGGFLINNLGDPYAGSHYASEVCALEREAVGRLMDLWGCERPAEFWGSVGASGTEGNLWALYLAREALPTARLVYSTEAHYSIPKAARILRIEATAVECTADGAIDLEAFARALTDLGDGPVIVALTCGTTVKGAHDDIEGVLACLDAAGFGQGRRFVHVDGALNAMVLPFAEDVPSAIRPDFRQGIDSMSTSGHKMIGTPMPCGVLIARRRHVERVASAIAYLRSNDTTLMGSRNGHAVLAIWARLLGHGATGFRADVGTCLARTDRLVQALRRDGVPVLRNRLALTVVFPEPADAIVRRYQLACHRGEAHAIVMPNVTDALLDRFLADYRTWWRRAAARHRSRPAAPPPATAAAGGCTEAPHSGLLPAIG